MVKGTSKITRVILYPLLIGAVVGVVYGAITLSRKYAAHQRTIEVQEIAETRLAEEVNKIQKVLLSIEQIPENLSYVLEFSHPKKEQMYVLLNALVSSNDAVYGTCIAFEPYMYHPDTLFYDPYVFKKNKNILIADPADSTYNYFSMDWYVIPRTLQKPVWIEPYYDKGFSAADVILSTYAVPFYFFDGKNEIFKGIVSIDIALDWLSDIISTLQVNDGSFSVMVSENGTVVASPYPRWSYNETVYSLAEEMKVPVLRDIGRDLKKGKSGSRMVGKMNTEQDWRVYYMPIPANNWGVLLFIPDESNN